MRGNLNLLGNNILLYEHLDSPVSSHIFTSLGSVNFSRRIGVGVLVDNNDEPWGLEAPGKGLERG